MRWCFFPLARSGLVVLVKASCLVGQLGRLSSWRLYRCHLHFVDTRGSAVEHAKDLMDTCGFDQDLLKVCTANIITDVTVKNLEQLRELPPRTGLSQLCRGAKPRLSFCHPATVIGSVWRGQLQPSGPTRPQLDRKSRTISLCQFSRGFNCLLWLNPTLLFC